MTEAEIANLKAFAKELLAHSMGGGYIDGADVEEAAVKHCLLVPVTYDPDVHGDIEDTEKGDTIHVFSDWLKG